MAHQASIRIDSLGRSSASSRRNSIGEVNAAFGNCPVLAEIYRRGEVVLPSGKIVSVDANGMPQTEAARLYDIVCAEKPRLTLEVGLAFGLSALCICQALANAGSGRHIVMDSSQSDFENAGLLHLERAGLRNLVEFYEESSHRVLPRLEAAGVALDFAFIDGSHLFDFTLLEFFYIDRMLKPGGLIVFDDMWMPSIRKIVRYAVTNRRYNEEILYPDNGPIRNAGRRIKRLARGLKAVPEVLGFALAGEGREVFVHEVAMHRPEGMAMIRKTRNDDRDWRFHVDF